MTPAGDPPLRGDLQVDLDQLKLRLQEWVGRREAGTDYSAFLRETELFLEQVPPAHQEFARQYIEELRGRFTPVPPIKQGDMHS